MSNSSSSTTATDVKQTKKRKVSDSELEEDEEEDLWEQYGVVKKTKFAKGVVDAKEAAARTMNARHKRWTDLHRRFIKEAEKINQSIETAIANGRDSVTFLLLNPEFIDYPIQTADFLMQISMGLPEWIFTYCKRLGYRLIEETGDITDYREITFPQMYTISWASEIFIADKKKKKIPVKKDTNRIVKQRK
jgi:hypothetical protein